MKTLKDIKAHLKEYGFQVFTFQETIALSKPKSKNVVHVDKDELLNAWNRENNAIAIQSLVLGALKKIEND